LKVKTKLETISDILSNYFAKDPTAQKKLKQYSVFAVWNDVVGARIAKHTQPVKMMDLTLVVRVESAAWLQELQYMKPQILKKIHAHVEPSLVQDIRLEIGRLEE